MCDINMALQKYRNSEYHLEYSISTSLASYFQAHEYPSESNQNAKVQGFASPRPPGMALSEFRNGQSTFSSSFKDDIAAFRR